MTQPLGPNSLRLSAAIKFGELLTRRMAERRVGQLVLAKAAGVSRASIVEIRHGRNLPTLEVALRIAEALASPAMAEIVRAARTMPCQRCGRPMLNEAGLQKRYCSAACRSLVKAQRRHTEAEEGVQILRQELLRTGPVRKQSIGRALTLFDVGRHDAREAVAAVDAYQDAVAGMCAACEPEGLCRTPECPLRGVSPLALESRRVDVQTAVTPLGRWGRPELRAAHSEAMRKRWAEPGRKETQAAKSRAYFAQPGVRVEHARRVSAGRRAGAAA